MQIVQETWEVNKILSIVAENTRNIIKAKGLKNKAVAEKAGYSEQKFSRMLNGQKVIESSDILRISNALDVTPNDLFGINKKK